MQSFLLRAYNCRYDFNFVQRKYINVNVFFLNTCYVFTIIQSRILIKGDTGIFFESNVFKILHQMSIFNIASFCFINLLAVSVIY